MLAAGQADVQFTTQNSHCPLSQTAAQCTSVDEFEGGPDVKLSGLLVTSPGDRATALVDVAFPTNLKIVMKADKPGAVGTVVVMAVITIVFTVVVSICSERRRALWPASCLASRSVSLACVVAGIAPDAVASNFVSVVMSACHHGTRQHLATWLWFGLVRAPPSPGPGAMTLVTSTRPRTGPMITGRRVTSRAGQGRGGECLVSRECVAGGDQPKLRGLDLPFHSSRPWPRRAKPPSQRSELACHDTAATKFGAPEHRCTANSACGSAPTIAPHHSDVSLLNLPLRLSGGGRF